ncbi:MAG TPA: MaoC family dehydratase [Pseudonocardiaceae bacterium]|jgi:acyl dehydratase|nr:MaoC family dehydratase [Pseudonocardiaceae bacterium]
MSEALRDTDFAVPTDDRYFEDYVVGESHEYGHETLTEAQILDFARQYDPQPIHTDPEYAAKGPFDGLIASGAQTVAIMMRLYVTHYLSHAASLASPGMDELRWPRPVRPNDALWLRATVLDARRSQSKPDRGVVRTAIELFNQHDEAVLTTTAVNFLSLRNP